MAGRQRGNPVLTYPFRAVLFQYTDRPREWHACCVENGACGWGPTPDAAIRELSLTINGQIRETFDTGADFFFLEPDEIWRRAFEDGISPEEEIRLVGRLLARLTIRLHATAESAPELKVELMSTCRQREPA